MNDIINKYLLSGDKLMAEMHLRQPPLRQFTYCTCGPFSKNKERSQNLKQQGIQDIVTEMN